MTDKTYTYIDQARNFAENAYLQKIVHLFRQLVAQESAILISIILIAGGTWGFIEIADEVIEGGTHAVDEAIILALRTPTDLSNPIGPLWVEEAMRDFTAMGGVGILIFLTISIVGFLFLSNRPQAAWLILITVAGGTALSLLLKMGFSRPRPDLVSHGSYVATASFPSGHSMLSATVYFTLGALLARFQPRRLLKIYVMVLMIVLTAMVGFSRVYLGVHWPTDVLAGWTAGAVWAALCWLVTWWLQKSGRIPYFI